MKKFIGAISLFLSFNASAFTVSDVMETYRLSNISPAEWAKNGDSMTVTSVTPDRTIKISAATDYVVLESMVAKRYDVSDTVREYDFNTYGFGPCYRLIGLIYESSGTWDDPISDESKYLDSIFSEDLKIHDKRSGRFKKWDVYYERTYSGALCSVTQHK
ncbi:hypothetical protein [Photobacterium damselae]|uniref:hypothetical protein n=1 Tax=Photobacterium damselae TaxID=38293 RepID=UPI000D665A91|nr:hypothetical protein [Photobacterium damselae]AWK84493.1 hypothetical protein BST98_20890 [Photobacterium damselae]